MLYNTGNHRLATAKALSSVQQVNNAKLYFDTWFRNAEDFFIDLIVHLIEEVIQRLYLNYIRLLKI